MILALWIVGWIFLALSYTGIAGVVGVGFYHLDDLAKLDVTDRAWRKFAGVFIGFLWPLTAAPVMLMPLLSEKHARMARMRKEYEEMERQVRKEMHQ